MKRTFLLIACCLALLAMSSCKSYTHSMHDPNIRYNFTSDDLELSEQVIGEAEVVKILGVDWKRLFGTSKSGKCNGISMAQIPVLGGIVDKGASYALYELMEKYPGYDVVVYPQVETNRRAPVLGSNIYSVTKYKVVARLGKLKNSQPAKPSAN